MRALTIDVGTGTQDVLLFDSDEEIENCVRMVLPSPTAIVADRVRRATAARWALVLTGATMGGGPAAWAIRDHALARLPVAATPDAARTLDDDLDAFRALGCRIVQPDEADVLAHQTHTLHLHLSDVWLGPIERALAAFDVDARTIDAVAVAVFDHGAAPVGVSDRAFRFGLLRERLLAEPGAGPLAFAFARDGVPAELTRQRAATEAAQGWVGDGRVVVMDTAAAAVAGALDEPAAQEALREERHVVCLNVGNFHALAMHLAPARSAPAGCRIEGLWEHHTGELDADAVRGLVERLVDGSLDPDAVFRTMGHGAFLRADRRAPRTPPLLLVTGPRRALLRSLPAGVLERRDAAPHGDMMQTGSFGLLRALAHLVPTWRDAVERRLGPYGARR